MVLNLRHTRLWPFSGGCSIDLDKEDVLVQSNYFHDGKVGRRKLIGKAPKNWPKDSIPAGKKRYGKRRAERRPEVEYHRPAKWKNRSINWSLRGDANGK
jgi:hypothetical protein